MFTCPRCMLRLERQQPRGGVYWACPKCAGRTATVAGLRAEAGEQLAARLWERAQKTDHDGELGCPACQNRMMAVAPSSARPDFYLDVCLRCHLVWFDTAEFQTARESREESAKSGAELPLQARLAMIRMDVEGIDPRRDLHLDATPPAENWKAIPAFFGMPVKHEQSTGLPPTWGTWCLTGIVLLFGVLGLLTAPRMFEDFGFVPAQPGRSAYATLLTAFFLHGSWPHLATSAYFLFTFGSDVEDLLGTARYLVLLAVAVLAGNALHAAIHPDSAVPLLGSGTGVSGLMAAFALRFPSARIGFFFHLPVFLYRWINLPAWLYILGWVVLQAIGALNPVEGLAQVSWAAHLGGAAAGLVAGLLLRGWASHAPPTNSAG